MGALNAGNGHTQRLIHAEDQSDRCTKLTGSIQSVLADLYPNDPPQNVPDGSLQHIMRVVCGEVA